MLLDVFNDVLKRNVTINALLISTGKMIPFPMTALADGESGGDSTLTWPALY